MHPPYIHLDPLRNSVVKQGGLIAGATLRRLSDAEAPGRVHLAEIGHGSVPRASFGPIGFNQHPIVVGLAVFVPAHLPEEHTFI